MTRKPECHHPFLGTIFLLDCHPHACFKVEIEKKIIIMPYIVMIISVASPQNMALYEIWILKCVQSKQYESIHVHEWYHYDCLGIYKAVFELSTLLWEFDEIHTSNYMI